MSGKKHPLCFLHRRPGGREDVDVIHSKDSYLNKKYFSYKGGVIFLPDKLGGHL